MKARAVSSEVWRNVVSGTTRAGLFALTLAVVSVALASIDLLTLTAQQAEARRFQASAADIRIVSDEQHIDPTSCDALRGTGNILAAGALRPATKVTLAAAASAPIPAYAATPGLGAVLGITDQDAGAWLPDTLADAWGVSPGDVLATTDGALTVAGTYHWPDDGRDQRLNYAVLLPVPASVARSSAFDECWATTWPLDPTTDDLLRTAAVVTSASTQALTIGQANNSYGAIYDPHADCMGRSTRLAWVGTVAAALLLGLLSTRRRRLEYAGALHAGQSRAAQVVAVLAETEVWTGSALLLAIAAGDLATALAAGSDAAALVDNELTGPLLTLVAAPVGAVVGVLLTSERHLFRYFKDR